MNEAQDIVYAGLWRRIQAWIVDLILIMLTVCVLALATGFVLSLILPILIMDKQRINAIYTYSGNVIGLTTFFAYFIGFEVSNLQATPGKILFNLKVTDMDFKRVGPVRALVRLLGKILSGFLLGFGLIICDFTAQKQAMHDIIANTLVIREKTKED